MPLPIRSLVPFAFVRNVATSIAFYERLGFELAKVLTPEAESEPMWASLVCGNVDLMLARARQPVVEPEHGVWLYLYVDDVQAKHAELPEAGAITYPFYAPRGEFQITDPDGYVLMITHT